MTALIALGLVLGLTAGLGSGTAAASQVAPATTLAATPSIPQAGTQSGRISGRVVSSDGRPIAGVTVVVQGPNLSALTDADGRYGFDRVAPGRYELALSLGAYRASESGVEVVAGGAAAVESAVDWPLFFYEEVVVTAASRVPEQLLRAPAAVTVVGDEEIERRATSALIPEMLAGTPGAEVTRSDLFDYNLNLRGFNGFVNRRVTTTIDGRDPTVPISLGYNDWSESAFNVGEIASAELVRGPASALYGAGAFGGVFDVRTKSPRDSLGGDARIVVGELDTVRASARQAGRIGEDWFYKAYGTYYSSHDFTVSRVGQVEYAPGQLPEDAVPPLLDRVEIVSAGARLDRYFGERRSLVMEGGVTHLEGTVAATPVGRSQNTDQLRPWARVSYSAPGWSVNGYLTGADNNDAVGLSSGAGVYQESYNAGVELQSTGFFAAGRGMWVAGATGGFQTIDTANPEGEQTALAEPERVGRGAVFGQIEYDASDWLRGALSLRFDDSQLYDARLSPRAALVFSVTPRQTVRFSFSHGFQSPTVLSSRLKTAVAPALDLSALEAALAPALGGVALNFGDLPLLAVGNRALRVEENNTFEVGYNAAVAEDLVVSATYYHNHINDFVTNLLPQVGTSLGRLNPDYGPYQPPDALSAAQQALVIGTLQAALPPSLFGALSNDADGAPIFVVLSLTNFGEATTQGLELGLDYRYLDAWRFNLGYTFFDFNIEQEVAESPLSPNTPGHQLSLSGAYSHGPFDLAVKTRWVDGFDWSSGIYVGPVPSYAVTTLNAAYRIDPRYEVGLDVDNFFDNDHYEAFGGSLLGRRALAYLGVSW